VTTESVPATTGLKLAAAGGTGPQAAAEDVVVLVGEVLVLAGLLLLEQAASPKARAPTIPIAANFRTGDLRVWEHDKVRRRRIAAQGRTLRLVGNIRVMIDQHDTVHAVEADFDTIFSWDYERSRGSLVKLYEKAKTSQWNATTDLDWSIDVDPEKIGRELGGGGPMRFQALQDAENSPVKHFGEKEWRQVSVEIQNSLLSQFMHGEQGALLCTARIVETVPWVDAKYYAATQVMDEARHVEVFARYLDEKLGSQYGINDNLKGILDDILRDPRWDIAYLGMQIMVEGLALAAFGMLHQITTEPLLKKLLRYVMSD